MMGSNQTRKKNNNKYEGCYSSKSEINHFLYYEHKGHNKRRLTEKNNLGAYRIIKFRPTTSSTIELEFANYASKWKTETGGYSTTIQKISNNNYLDIIGMGEIVVPFILNDLKKESHLWFAALRAITKENPIKPEHMGSLRKMREDWLSWGKENNII